MKKINALIKKFFGIGAGEDVSIITIAEGGLYSRNDFRPWAGYVSNIDQDLIRALKVGSSIIIDHNKKTVTFKAI